MTGPSLPPELMPVLTDETPSSETVEGQGAIINGGSLDVRKTHPNLWRVVMAFAVINVLLGLNFMLLHPAFLIYHQSNYLWGLIFLILGMSKITFLNFYRNLRLVRLTMGCEVAFMTSLALGATEPVFTSSASLQLPILYLGLAALELPLMLEPFINPWTARREGE